MAISLLCAKTSEFTRLADQVPAVDINSDNEVGMGRQSFVSFRHVVSCAETGASCVPSLGGLD
jgi:hypothetical protein